MKKNHGLSNYTCETKGTVPVCYEGRVEFLFDGVLFVYFKGSELSLVCFTLTLYKLNSLSLSWFYERRCLVLEGQILGEDHLIF